MDKIRVLEDALTNYLEVVESDGLKYLRKHSESYQQCKDRAAKILENDKINLFFTEADELHLNKEETILFREYLNVEGRMNSLGLLYAYLRGYTDHEALQQLFNEIGHIFNE